MDFSSTSESRTTDWTKCCICQLDRKEDLKSPQTNPVKKGDDEYVTIPRTIAFYYKAATSNRLNQLTLTIELVANYFRSRS